MTKLPFQHEREISIELARQAGESILRYYSDPASIEVAYKDSEQSNPVTNADQAANAIIVEGLQRAFPNDAILAEESSLDPQRHASSRLWCIDPLDGTKEFLARNGMFVVMIGLAIEGEAAFGVVYHPTTGRLYVGGGDQAEVYLPGCQHPQTLKVSSCQNSVGARLAVSRSHRSSAITQIAKTLELGPQLPLGSVGLKGAAIADETADVYISLTDKTQEWDACAPEAIVRAAGGMMTDLLGRPLQYNKKATNTPYGMLATATPKLHQQCVDAIQAHRDRTKI